MEKIEQCYLKRTKVLKEDKGCLFSSMCFGTLENLRNIKNFATFTLTKHLVVSCLDFGDIVLYPLAQHLLERLQRTQYSAASFMTELYVNSIESILKLGNQP